MTESVRVIQAGGPPGSRKEKAATVSGPIGNATENSVFTTPKLTHPNSFPNCLSALPKLSKYCHTAHNP